jgi:hypothetical protein
MTLMTEIHTPETEPIRVDCPRADDAVRAIDSIRIDVTPEPLRPLQKDAVEREPAHMEERQAEEARRAEQPYMNEQQVKTIREQVYGKRNAEREEAEQILRKEDVTRVLMHCLAVQHQQAIINETEAQLAEQYRDFISMQNQLMEELITLLGPKDTEARPSSTGPKPADE